MSEQRAHGAFLVCYWRYNGEQRIEVEHLQSGTRASLATFAEVDRWMEARARMTASDTWHGAGEDMAARRGAASRPEESRGWALVQGDS